MPSRNWIVWILILCCVGLVILLRGQMDNPGDSINQSKFKELVDRQSDCQCHGQI